MDSLFYPSIGFGGGGAEGFLTLLVRGSPSFLLRFSHVGAVCCYSETVYWSLATETSRPRHVLNRVIGSPLLAHLRNFRGETDLEMFLVCGGDMCCEVVAYGAYALTEYPSEDLAEAALACEITGVAPAPSLNWRLADHP